jgi:putative inorganic carbon (hco3(-)) transporter
MSLLKIFIFLLFLIYPLGEVARFSLGSDVAITFLDVIVGLSSFVFLLLVLLKKQTFPNTSLTKPFLIFVCIAGLSLLINSIWLKPQQLFTAFLYLLRWTSYAFLPFIFMQFSEKSKKQMLSFLFLDGLIIILLGFLQYFFYPSLQNLYYLGWDEHVGRMFSVFFDPNFAGTIFVLYFILVSGALFHFWQKKRVKPSLFACVILALTLIAIFLTHSRSTLLMLLVSAIVFLILIRKKILLLLLLAIFGIILIIPPPRHYTENANLFRITSGLSRVEPALHALTIIQRNPVFGIGFNTYRYAQVRYGFTLDKTYYPSHADAGVDNSLLFVGATTGIIGLIAYLYFWITVLKTSYHSFHAYKGILPAVLIASIAGLFIVSFFINALFYPACMVWIGILVGLVREN